MRVITCDPPFEEEGFEQNGHWTRPMGTEEAKKKMLRKQIFAGLVAVLRAVADHLGLR